MIESKRGKITKELFARPGICAYMVEIDNKEARCLSYPDLVGQIEAGDEVLLNTTAVSLQLGSGGYHYVIAKLNSQGRKLSPGGHIMKLRYTPLQLKVLSVEEEDSPHRAQMLQADSLENTPVLVATLHSMLAPLCMHLAQNNLRTAYIMTDGAALPLAFSETVAWLKNNKLLAGSITIGHAFGGDLEAVNIYSGLLAAYKVMAADVIIVSMGPGIVGTGSKWGFTGVEQGEILNAVETLGGIPVAVPRISFTDSRERHRGISHHSLTVLSRVCRVKAVLPLPVLEDEKMAYLLEQLQKEKIDKKHHLCFEDESWLLKLLQESELKITTMGRGVEQEREFYLALGAAARVAARLRRGEELHVIKQA
ncbi:MAG: DUF3866 family protein [Syntrophomonadaceae bacterium]|nr:DUF3866 family protein [Syntrophomonadaceae bacterium]